MKSIELFYKAVIQQLREPWRCKSLGNSRQQHTVPLRYDLRCAMPRRRASQTCRCTRVTSASSQQSIMVINKKSSERDHSRRFFKICCNSCQIAYHGFYAILPRGRWQAPCEPCSRSARNDSALRPVSETEIAQSNITGYRPLSSVAPSTKSLRLRLRLASSDRCVAQIEFKTAGFI